jgi:histidinol-phosphate aminotransferase
MTAAGRERAGDAPASRGSGVSAAADDGVASGPIPRPGVGAPPYRVPRAAAPIDLPLDANEGAAPDLGLLARVGDLARAMGRYPSAAALEAKIAARIGVAPSQVIATAGADDALDRACRAVLGPGTRALLPEPGFAMLRRYVELAGAAPTSIAWPDGPLPTDALIAALDDDVRLIAVTSPNNPTGAVATADDLRRLSAAAPRALLLVDLAYVEFGDDDLTATALALPNAVLARTFSKAWGLAGLRVGYAAGPDALIGWLRGIGLPYAASGLSLALVDAALDDPGRMTAFVARVRQNRAALASALAAGGARPQASQANFVLARVDDPLGWRDGLAGLGIGIRAFPGVSGLGDAIRIAVPGERADLERVMQAIATLRAPSRLLIEVGSDASDADRSSGGSAVASGLGPGAWLLASTPAAVVAARAAGALPLAIGPRAADLIPFGAARAVTSPDELRWPFAPPPAPIPWRLR